MKTIADMKSTIESNKAAQMGIITPEVLGRAQVQEDRLLGAQKEYSSEVEEAAKEGLRPETCIHGTYMWSDYDVICPGCEGGEFTEWTPADEVREVAMNFAIVETLREADKAEKELDKFVQNCDLAQSIMSEVLSVKTQDDGTFVVFGYIKPETLATATVGIEGEDHIDLKVF